MHERKCFVNLFKRLKKYIYKKKKVFLKVIMGKLKKKLRVSTWMRENGA